MVLITQGATPGATPFIASIIAMKWLINSSTFEVVIFLKIKNIIREMFSSIIRETYLFMVIVECRV